MSDVHGFTHSAAINRAPVGLREQIAPHINKLNEIGVKADSKSVAEANRGSFADIGRAASIHASLKALVGDKASSMLESISLKAIGGDFHEKLERSFFKMDGQQLKTLKDMLHYSAKDVRASNTSSEDRTLVRTALVLAFAKGADFNELSELRDFLNKPDTKTAARANVLEALGSPGANPTKVLENLTSAGPDRIDKLIGHWTSHNQWGSEGQLAEEGKLEPLVHDAVDAFFNKNPEYAVYGRAGATALSAYSTDAYARMNRELRSGNVSGDVKTLVAAGEDFLAKLPDFQGIVSRGGGSGWQDAALERYKPGAIVTEQSFVSSSPDKGFKGSIQFIIESRHGKELSGLSTMGGVDGREVLFAPGTKFEVIAVERGEETHSVKSAVYGDVNVDNTIELKDETGKEKLKMNPDGTVYMEKTMFIIMREVD